jgi:hypothetical protein
MALNNAVSKRKKILLEIRPHEIVTYRDESLDYKTAISITKGILTDEEWNRTIESFKEQYCL